MYNENGLYYVGQLNRGDNAIAVFRSRRYDQNELQAALQMVASDRGVVQVFTDGVCIVSDSATSLERIASALEDMERHQPSVWVVQLYAFSGSNKELQSVGFDSAPFGEIAAEFQKLNLSGGVDISDLGVDVRASFQSLFQAIQESDQIEFSTAPVFHLVDGSTSTYNRVTSVPYRSTTTTTGDSAGSRTQTEIAFASGGISIDVLINERSNNTAELDLQFQVSQITPRVDGIPGTSTETFNSKTIVSDKGLYLVGAFNTNRNERSQKRGLTRFNSGVNESEKLLIWASVSRAGSGSQGVERSGDTGTGTAPMKFEELPQ